VRDFLEWVDRLDGARAPLVEQLASEAQRLLGTPISHAYQLNVRDDRVQLADIAYCGYPVTVETAEFGALLGTRPIGWTAWNPVRPAPIDQNRILSRADLARRGVGDPPVLREWFARFGLASHDQLRVVVCERASMLAYVGVMQPEAFDEVQRASLQAVVPALRRRLALERALGVAARSRAILSTALEALPAPAFLVDREGRIEATNALGRARVARDRTGTRTWLRDAVRASGFDAAAQITPLVGPGEPACHLVIERAESVAVRARAKLDALAGRLALTPRQREVLEWIARGLSNRAIAAELGIAEPTVEQHVRGLMQRADVESRAALVAQLLWSAPDRIRR
jgi:DNA-binding CsgD family transcriptional regulator